MASIARMDPKSPATRVRLDDPTTYADFAPVYLEAIRNKNLKPETQLSYTRNVMVHIVPELGAIRILDTTSEVVQEFTRYLLSDMPPRSGRPEGGPITVNYARQIRNTCSAMLDLWAEDHPMPRDGNGNPVNPWKNTGRISGSRRPKRGKTWVPDEQDMDAWRAEMPEDMRIMFDILSYTGDRGCEVWALQERDITWKGKDRRAPLGPQLAALAELDDEAFAATGLVLHTTRKMERDRTTGDVKNALADRELPLDRELAASLAAHFAVLPPRDGWLFYNIRPDHGPMKYDAKQALQLESDVARLWAEEIPEDTPHGSGDLGAGTSADGLAFVLSAGRPVTTAEVADAIGTTVNNASAHLSQQAKAGKLIKGGTARCKTWEPGPRAMSARMPGVPVGWSRQQIADKLGTDASTVQRILRRIPARPGEPLYSLGINGKPQPRYREDRAPAARGIRPENDGELRLWVGYSFRRWLRLAAEQAGVPLPKGQATHTIRHYRVNQLLAAGMAPENVAEWIGDTTTSVMKSYTQPSRHAKADAMAAIQGERARAKERTQPPSRSRHLAMAGHEGRRP
jgi:hypothetical protein